MSLDKTIGEVWNDEYVVPLYQRNFAWTDTQIGQLLQDIWDHAPKTKEEVNQRGNYYLGNLVILLRRDGKYEVIDGQQRLTALHMICRYLGLLNRPRLTYDSRPAVERFLEELLHLIGRHSINGAKKQIITRLLDWSKHLTQLKHTKSGMQTRTNTHH